jgi:carboxyl-terminal processing protease
MRGVILDLRGNRGGLLHEAIDVVDLFLDEGVMISTKGRHSKSSHAFNADKKEIAKGVPIVVMIDGKSASAAEIVAASLQARGRAVVVGSNSYGKGVVQTVVRLPNGGEMTVTWSRLVGPAGNTFNEIGVMPTFCALGEEDRVERQIGRLHSSELPTLEALARWLAASKKVGVERDQVRAVCRGEEKDGTLGLRLARRLLNDAALYASALDVSSASFWDEQVPEPVAALDEAVRANAAVQ